MSSEADPAPQSHETGVADVDETPGEELDLAPAPVQPTWFFQDPVAKSWRPLQPADQTRAEAAFQQGRATVSVEYGRYMLHIKHRKLRPQFWKFRAERVIRATWFSASGSTIEPYEEADAERLELMVEARKVNAPMPLQGGQRCVVLHQPNGVSFGKALEEHPPRGSGPMFSALGRPLKYSCGLFEYRVNPRTGSASGRGRYVFRGLPSWAMPRGLQPDPRPVSHVVFVVHGIGEALHTHASTTFPLETLRAAVDEFRGMTASVVDQHREDLNAMYCYARAQALVADDPAGGAPSQPPAGAGGEQGQPESDPYPPPPPKGRIEYVPIEWHHEVHDAAMLKRIRSVALQTAAGVRDFVNHGAIDVVLYMMPGFRDRILATVAKQMNALHESIRAAHPNLHASAFSILAHSLGTVVTFDLLRGQLRFEAGTSPRTMQKLPVVPRLEFKPRIFFTMGSPIGCFSAFYKPGPPVPPAVPSEDQSPASGPAASEDTPQAGEGDAAMLAFPPLTEEGLAATDVHMDFPRGIRVLNIFHPLDPLAFRVEPVLAPELEGEEPVEGPEAGAEEEAVAEEVDDAASSGASEAGSEAGGSTRSGADSMRSFRLGTPLDPNSLRGRYPRLATSTAASAGGKQSADGGDGDCEDDDDDGAWTDECESPRHVRSAYFPEPVLIAPHTGKLPLHVEAKLARERLSRFGQDVVSSVHGWWKSRFSTDAGDVLDNGGSGAADGGGPAPGAEGDEAVGGGGGARNADGAGDASGSASAAGAAGEDASPQGGEGAEGGEGGAGWGSWVPNVALAFPFSRGGQDKPPTGAEAAVTYNVQAEGDGDAQAPQGEATPPRDRTPSAASGASGAAAAHAPLSASSCVASVAESAGDRYAEVSARRAGVPPARVEAAHIFRSAGRLDFVLQETMLEAHTGYLATLTAHTQYFTSEDVAFFIAKQLTLSAAFGSRFADVFQHHPLDALRQRTPPPASAQQAGSDARQASRPQ